MQSTFKKPLIFGILLFPVWFGSGFSSNLWAQALFQGLDFPPSARGWGMGAAVCGIADNNSAIQINPAFTALASPGWEANYTRYLLDIYSSSVHGFFKIPYLKQVGAGFQYLNYGHFTGRDEAGEKTGEYSAGDLLASISYGYPVTQKLSLGLTLNYIYSNLADYSAQGLYGTIGLLYRHLASSTTLGISFRNWGGLFKGYLNPEEKVTTGIMIGFSKKLQYLPMLLAIDTFRAQTGDLILRLGGEFTFGEIFFLRFGSSTRRFQLDSRQTFRNFLAGSSIGVGYRLQRITFDIAFVGLGDLGTLSSISIRQQF
jgi:hypothetical protein